MLGYKFSDVDRLFNGITRTLDSFTDSLTHNYQAEIKDGKLLLSWDVPGAKKTDLEVSTEEQILIVSGKGGRYQGFNSKIRINPDYDMQTSEASIEDGVLTVTISKGKNVRKQTIQIK